MYVHTRIDIYVYKSKNIREVIFSIEHKKQVRNK